jgi:hypothetical protein
MNNMKKCLLYIFLMVIPFLLNAQYQLLPAFNTADGLTLKELEQVQVNTIANGHRQLWLRVEVYGEGRKLQYSRESFPFRVEPGRQVAVKQIWRKGKKEFIAPELELQTRTHKVLPRGEYEICLILFDLTSKTRLVQYCQFFEVAEVRDQSAGFNASGDIRLSYTYAVRQWYGSTLPPEFWRFEAHPTFNWKGIPFGLDVFWTNEDNRFGRPMDAISFRFDAETFQAQLREKLEARLAEEQSGFQEKYRPDFAEEAALAKTLSRMEKVDTSFLRQELQKEEHRLDSLKELAVRPRFQSPDFRDCLRQVQAEKEKQEKRVKKLQQEIKQYLQLLQREEYLQNRWKKLKSQNDSLREEFSEKAKELSPRRQKQLLLENGILDKGRAVLLAVDRFQLGAYYLNYSPLVLNGSQINGVDLAFRLSPNWRISVAGGKVTTPRFPDSLDFHLPRPNTLAGKFEWKADPAIELYLGSIHSWENNNEIYSSTDETQILIAGYKWRAPKVDMHWSVDVAHCSIDQFSENKLAWHTEFSSHFLDNRFDFLATWQRTGSEYQDLGSPFLRQGMETQDVQLNSHWWKNRLSLGLFYQRDHNRPLGFSPFSLQNQQMGGASSLTYLKDRMPSSSWVIICSNKAGRTMRLTCTHLFYSRNGILDK